MSHRLRKTLGGVAVICGLMLAAFGSWWAPAALAALDGALGGGWLELIVPFLPMAVIGMGALLLTKRGVAR